MSRRFDPQAGFETEASDIGRLAVRPMLLPEDAAMVHEWVGRPYARFWAMGDKSLAEIVAFYQRMAASSHEAAYIGLFESQPAFLVETYDPRHHELARHYDVEPGDRGMHVLVAPAERPIHGFTGAVFRAVMDFLFSDPSVRRVVVEPDVRNAKIHALNARHGFVRHRDVALADKTAALSFCSREHYRAALDLGEAA